VTASSLYGIPLGWSVASSSVAGGHTGRVPTVLGKVRQFVKWI